MNDLPRLLSYSVDGQSGYGLVSADGDGVVALGPRMPEVADLGQLIASGRLGEVVENATTTANAQPDVALDDITFERLLPWPSKIFCIGVNYGGRAAEYADASDAAYPSVFPRFPDGFTGHNRPLIRPPESEQLDYEGEIVVVIGKAGRRIPVADARDHVAGLTLGNEGTIRNWVRHAKFNVTQGKNWPSSGALGPWLVPMTHFDGDNLDVLDSFQLTTTVNGELRQQDTPASMKYSIAYQIHYLSTFTTLRPGDVIFTGTPTGAGARRDPPVWLKPGDVIEVSVPELGTLRNTVADEFPPGSPEAAFTAPDPQ